MDDIQNKINQLRDLASKATPGPWEVVCEHGCSIVYDGNKAQVTHHVDPDPRPCVGTTADNCRFIAAARTAVPELCDELERLREALKELVIAADPNTNMSDIVVFDALSVARNALTRKEDSGE